MPKSWANFAAHSAFALISSSATALHGSVASPLSSRANPDFLPRGTGHDNECAFLYGKAHEVCQRHQVPQEIRGSRGTCGLADLSWECFWTGLSHHLPLLDRRDVTL